MTRSWGGLLAAFLLLVNFCTPGYGTELVDQYIAKAKNQQLHNSRVWLALLHQHTSSPSIQDRSFYLSTEHHTPELELQATLTELYEKNPRIACRFPARYFWLRQVLDLPELSLSDCPEIQEFLENAPADQISLVFASESLAQPASMMGHAFLKLSGKASNGELREHAISFFTDADTYNIPKLFVESLITGKKGYFALSPYRREIERYVNDEQRSLWEFDLDLSPAQIRLLQLHLLELKQSELSYYFHRYNCATVLRFITALTGKIPNSVALWVTPKDVVKDADSAGLISTHRVISPSRWIIRALSEQLDLPLRNHIKTAAESGNLGAISYATTGDGFLKLQYTLAYNQYAYSSGQISQEIWEKNKQTSAERAPDFRDFALNEGDFLNPISTPNDSQLAITSRLSGPNQGLRLTFLPTSHQLADDNRNFPTETALELMGVTLRYPLGNDQLGLDRLVVYHIKSLIPYDPITGGISGKFSVLFESVPDQTLAERRGFSTVGAIGRTYRIHRDVDVYLLFGGGVQHSQSQWKALLNNESGVILRGVWDTKTVFTHEAINIFAPYPDHYQEFRLQQVKFLDRAFSFHIGMRHRLNSERRESIFEAGVKQVF